MYTIPFIVSLRSGWMNSKSLPHMKKLWNSIHWNLINFYISLMRIWKVFGSIKGNSNFLFYNLNL